MVGGTTVLRDDPSLTVRHVAGRSPLRVVLDRSGVAPADSRLFTDGAPTLLFTNVRRSDVAVEQVLLPIGTDPLPHVLRELHERGLRSLLVEGGARLHEAFFESGSWDEARVMEAPLTLGSGTSAPTVRGIPAGTSVVGADRISTFVRSTELRRPEKATLPDPWC